MRKYSFSWIFRGGKYNVEFSLPLCRWSHDVVMVCADFNEYSGCEQIIANARRNPHLEFILFTDNSHFEVDIPSNLFVANVKWSGFLSRLVAKFFKLQHYLFLRNIKYVVWLDANLKLKTSFDPLKLISNQDLQFFSHNKRSTLIEELYEVRKRGKDDCRFIESLLFQTEYHSLPLFQGRFFISKNSADIGSFFDRWWESVLNGSIRDQLSLPKVLYEFDSLKLRVLGSSTSHELFDVVQHKYFDVSVGSMSFKSRLRAYYSKILFNIVKRISVLKGFLL